MTLVINGMGGLLRKFADLEGEARKGAERGLFALGNNIMTEAKQRTPVDMGILRASGYVEARQDGMVELGFGGAAGAYAVKQHEDLSLNHPGGGQAKFLESAVDDARPSAAAFVGKFVKEAMTK